MDFSNLFNDNILCELAVDRDLSTSSIAILVDTLRLGEILISGVHIILFILLRPILTVCPFVIGLCFRESLLWHICRRFKLNIIIYQIGVVNI